MAKVVYLKNFRRGLATNSSSTHSIIYRNENDMFEDMDIFELDYYDRYDSTIAASRKAKIKYVLAEVWRNEKLTELLSNRYPEMKEYFPLIKKTVENEKNGKYDYDGFGMYCRGSFSVSSNLEFSYDFCCDLIDDDEKIIIGGSDEMDFVYDTVEGHKEADYPDNIEYNTRDRITKNGNYYYAFGHGGRTNHSLFSDYCKLRFSFNKEKPIPEYPELIDLKITGKCNHNCPMCFEGSTMNGEHADINYLKLLVRSASDNGKQVIEYSIGGGNILLYPELEELFKTIKKYNGYVNVTIKADDVETILRNDKFLKLFEDYVDGCGVSVFNEEDAKKVQEFNKVLNYDNRSNHDFSYKVNIVAHIIPEYIGYKTSKKIKDMLSELKHGEYWKNISVLYLGYKELERGKSQSWKRLTDKELKGLFGESFENIDTLFGQRYKEWLSKNFEFKYSYTRNEGEYSMYVDAVNKKVYMSSYNLEKPYELERPFAGTVVEVFNKIRKDNGFEIYDENNKKHYWDE